MLAFDILKNLFKKSETKEPSQIKPENKIPVIDVSEPAEQATQELLSQYEKFSNYDEILQIDKADREMLLKDIYESWNIHGIPKFFKEKYSKYDEKIIEQVYARESNRLNLRIKAYHYKEMCQRYNPLWFDILGWGSTLTGKGADFQKATCSFEDILNLNLTNDLDCFFENGRFAGLNIITNIKGIIKKEYQNPIKFYHNGELHIMDKKEFKKYKKKYNLMLYLNSIEANQELWKKILKEKGIPFDENKHITKKFFWDSIKKYKDDMK